jgi:hypothetical protein
MRANDFAMRRAKRDPGGFVALPNIVIRSHQIARLSAHAVKLLFDLLAQYNGGNNGDLCATWTLMQPRGWKSRDTLGKALKELTTKHSSRRRDKAAGTRQACTA